MNHLSGTPVLTARHRTPFPPSAQPPRPPARPGFGQSGGPTAKHVFSNDWKKSSNGWKNGLIFPMIGKKFRPFSNDWKKFSRPERSGAAV
jgi:hypothetical protein